MKVPSFLSVGLMATAALANKVSQNTFKYERLDKNNAVSFSEPLEKGPSNMIQLLLVVDIQEGLYQIARDFDPTLYRDQALAHAALGEVFDLPVILTTSADQGKLPSLNHIVQSRSLY